MSFQMVTVKYLYKKYILSKILYSLCLKLRIKQQCEQSEYRYF